MNRMGSAIAQQELPTRLTPQNPARAIARSRFKMRQKIPPNPGRPPTATEQPCGNLIPDSLVLFMRMDYADEYTKAEKP